MFGKVVKMRIVFLATIIVALVHWQVTKDKPLSGAIENYLNTDDIDTTIIGNPTK